MKSWFLQDDFAWLALGLEPHSFRDLCTALFEPKAQGTVRVLSERAFFLTFSRLFGMDALPFHIFTLSTQAANLVLLQWITWRLSASRMAGAAAAIAWAVNSDIAIPLAWLSAYNQILCAFFALGAFAFLILYKETGRRRDWILQWVCYLCGFLSLELIVVYPAIACLYVWIAARQHIRKALWLWLPALAFTAVHFFLIPKAAGAKYQMIFDAGMIRNLGMYAFRGIGPSDVSEMVPDVWTWLGTASATAVAIAAAIFCFTQFGKGNWLPALPLAWFVGFIAPVLPLQHHVSDYYLALPSAGFAMLIGWTFAWSASQGWLARIPAILIAAVFVWGEFQQVYFNEFWYRVHGLEMRSFLSGVNEIYHRRNASTILIAGVDDGLITGGIGDNPFRLYGIENAYLAPGTEARIRSVPKEKIPFLVDQGAADSLLASARTIVVAVTGDKVADVTETYRAMRAGNERITLVRPADASVAGRLGSGWYQIEPEFRWMAGMAVVHLDAPPAPHVVLSVSVSCPRLLLDNSKDDLELSVSLNHQPLGRRKITEGNSVLRFEIPKGLGGSKEAEVILQMNRTLHSGDGRELGLAVMEVALISQ